MPGVIANKYELVRVLGSGGTGAVYEARHLTLSNRRVAIKHLHSEYRGEHELSSRFIREAQTAAAIEHPGVVAILDVEHDEALGPVVVMELLEGTPVDRIARKAAIEWGRASGLMVQVLEAVAAAHALGVVHRDIKPANLFVVRQNGRERVKVLDFGIARVFAGDQPALTQPGSFVGTMRYASPEQRADASRADERSDVYSLGITFIEMLTGRPANLDETPGARDALLDRIPEHGGPPELRAIVARAIEPDPRARFPSAPAMRDALLALMAAHGVSLDSPATGSTSMSLPPSITRDDDATVASRSGSLSRPMPTVRRRRRRRAVIAASVVGLILSTALGFVGARRGWWGRGTNLPIVLPTGASLSERERGVLVQACADWSVTLLASQSPDGAFTANPHFPPSGWDTAQQVAVLETANRRCEAVDDSALTRAFARIAALRHPDGWSTFTPNDETPGGQTPGTAWVTLAYARRAQTDASARAGALDARAALLGFVRADGGFEFSHRARDLSYSNAYSTLMALWALAETEALDPSPPAVTARRNAAAWLRRAFVTATLDPPLRAAPGLGEQAFWVLWHTRLLCNDRDPGDAQLAATMSRTILSRCTLTGGAPRGCARPMRDDNHAVLGVDDGGTVLPWHRLETPWFPWALASATVLLRDDTVSLPGATRDDLGALVHWSVREIDVGRAAMAEEPSYRLAEKLLSIASLLDAPR